MMITVRTFGLCLLLIVMGRALVFSQGGTGRELPKTSPPSKTSLPARRTTPSRKSTPSPTGKSGASSRQTVPNIVMVFVPGGTFLMGSSQAEVRAAYEEAKRIRDVDVFNNYSLEEFSWEKPKHQVTVSSFYMGKYEVTQAQYQAVMGTNPSSYKGDNLPVENVTWNNATEFCSKLSRMTGRKYRLPTEAEWEYACRAGTTGDYAGELDAMAWYRN